MTVSFFDRREGRIAYDVAGAGPLVVCQPGMGDLRSVYRFLRADLVAAGFRVATVDLRGHGDSDDGFSAFDDVAAGQDLVALIDHLGGPAVVVGNSMAGGAAVWAAAERPDAVAGLALIAPFVRDSASMNPMTRLAFRLALVRPWGPALWQAFYRRSYPTRPPADLASHQHSIAASLRRGQHWRAFVRTTRTTHAPAAARLGGVRAPVLVVIGDRDPDWPDPVAEARWVAETLNGELVVVAGAGHYPMAEFPETVSPAVAEFARRAHVTT
jgi:pimeloyl-ACP methyl ester carboxylesterase